MTPLLRRWPLFALAAAAIAGAATTMRAGRPNDPSAALLVATASVGDLEETVDAVATLRPARLVAVGAQVSGRITSLKVSVGQTVRAGQLIATIDSLVQENDLKTAEATLAYAQAQKREKEANLAYSQASLERAARNLEKSAISRDAYDSAKATVDATRAQIDALAAQIAENEVKVDNARVNLAYTRIVAPIDGTVLLLNVQEGQTVNAVQSAPTIAILGQIDRMAVRAEISEADAPRVRVGQEVRFTILGEPNRVWRARLESIDPAPDGLRSDSEIAGATTSSSTSSSSTATTAAIYYYGRFAVPNEDGLLKTYMTAQTQIVIDSVKGAVLAPAAALSSSQSDGRRTVEILGADGALSTRPVDVGISDKISVQIRSGLKAGERVVTGRRSVETKQSAMPPPPGV